MTSLTNDQIAELQREIESLLSAQGGDAEMNEVKSPFMQQSHDDVADLISRQAAIKNAHFPMIDDAGYKVVRVDDILALPSAEPKTGEWVCTDDGWEYGKCSECGCDAGEPYGFVKSEYNFCPHCGADMRGKEE